MQKIWKIIYSFLIIPLLLVAIIILSLFRSKVRRAIRGRRNLFKDLGKKASNLNKKGLRFWFHAASMGEFEQAKPIITMLKEKLPDAIIIVSFFSPSGYENNLKYDLADIITYIPFDSRKNARLFLNIIKPDIAILIRYDIWPNHLWELNNREIPVFLVDATMSAHSNRKLPIIKNFHIYLFSGFKGILTVSKSDEDQFGNFSCFPPNVQAIGDTRYDQVYLKSIKAKEKKLIPQEILKGRKVFIVGSSWEGDEKIIFPVFKKLIETYPDLLMILVPHEPTEENLDKVETELKNKIPYIRFSQLLNYKNEKIIIIDCIGLLLSLYAYGHVAYVGGGFGEGIHNTLEPATYGIPVIFGPRYQNSQEAKMLINLGGGFEVTGENDLFILLDRFLKDENSRIDAGEIAGGFVKQNIGATDKIFEYFKNFIIR